MVHVAFTRRRPQREPGKPCFSIPLCLEKQQTMVGKKKNRPFQQKSPITKKTIKNHNKYRFYSIIIVYLKVLFVYSSKCIETFRTLEHMIQLPASFHNLFLNLKTKYTKIHSKKHQIYYKTDHFTIAIRRNSPTTI